MDIKRAKKTFWIRHKYYIIGGFLFLVLIAYLLVTSVGPSKLSQNIENLQISEAKEDNFTEYLDLEGIAQPKLTVKLNSYEPGIIKRIVAEDGATLKKGDTILVLINPDLLREIEDERDDFEKQQISYKGKLLEMEKSTSELKRNMMKTIYDLNRLSKQHNLDKEEYTIGIKSKAQLDVSTEEYVYNQKNTKFLLQELKQDSIRNSVQKNLLVMDRERAEKKYAQNRSRIANLIVKAPIDGQLSFLSVIPGEKITAGENIGELKEVENMKITASISEYYMERISLGLPAFITYKGQKYPLTVSKINPEIKDRNFVIDLLFTGKVPENIHIGRTYHLQIELGKPEKALVIDKGNFYQATGGQWIFKINKDENKAVRTPITIGRQNPLQYEIVSGLKPHDRVIISGYDSFGDVQQLKLK
jgi:multidrug efflux pump subunit AcrA (membrane-fusion protein)